MTTSPADTWWSKPPLSPHTIPLSFLVFKICCIPSSKTHSSILHETPPHAHASPPEPPTHHQKMKQRHKNNYFFRDNTKFFPTSPPFSPPQHSKSKVHYRLWGFLCFTPKKTQKKNNARLLSFVISEQRFFPNTPTTQKQFLICPLSLSLPPSLFFLLVALLWLFAAEFQWECCLSGCLCVVQGVPCHHPPCVSLSFY